MLGSAATTAYKLKHMDDDGGCEAADGHDGSRPKSASAMEDWRLWARWSVPTCFGCLVEIGNDVFWLCKLLSGPAAFTMISASDFADLPMHIENAFVQKRLLVVFV